MYSLKKSIILTICISFAISCTSKSQDNHSHTSKYAGEEQRVIKTLSASDVEELQTGKGWGLAKAAELNGVPGPRHLLDMKDEINLTIEQIEKIQALFDEMKVKAMPLGNELIDLEQELNTLFAKREINEGQLKELLQKIADTQSALRFVHLKTHLQSLPILTPEQIRQYNSLRGYGSGDPCENVQEGHDPKMWRKHNNCN